MTRRHHQLSAGQPPTAGRSRCRCGRGVQLFSLVFATVAAGTLLPGCSRKADSQPPSAESAAPGTNLPAAVVPKPEFTRLVGKWLRPDGGYVLELKSVDGQGKLEAAYLNPNPINVSKALALQDGTTTKVFVELRDANYPGCTYSLAYDPKSDQLYGQYFQAAMQQTFDVVFERMK